MGYDAGCNFVCGGSWQAPEGDGPPGRLISGNGLVKATRIEAGRVRLTLLVAVSPENIACVVTPRRDYPVGGAWCVSPVDNANYDVKSLSSNGEDLVDRNFDFVFVKFGQPQQG